MRIGELSAQTGVSPRLLRYYEEQGLLVVARTASGYRDYGPDAATVVRQIRALLTAGLSTAVIRDVLPCAHGPAPQLEPHPAMFAMLRRELDQVEAKIECLTETRDLLTCYLRTTEAGVAQHATVGAPVGQICPERGQAGVDTWRVGLTGR